MTQSQEPAVRLVALEGIRGVVEFEVPPGGTLLFGRSQSCQVVLDDDDVSREHCRLTSGAGGCQVEDLASMNGTYLNGVRLTAPTMLVNGDLLVLGRALFEVHVPELRRSARTDQPLPHGSVEGGGLAGDMRQAAQSAQSIFPAIDRAVALLKASSRRSLPGQVTARVSAEEAQRLAATCRQAAALTHPGQRTAMLAGEVGPLRKLVTAALVLYQAAQQR